MNYQSPLSFYPKKSVSEYVKPYLNKYAVLTVFLFFLTQCIPLKTFGQEPTPSTLAVALNFTDLKTQLLNAPNENDLEDARSPYQIEIPLAEDRMKIAVWESSILSVDLALAYPHLKTYAFYGIDDPFVTGRITLTENWLNIFLISKHGTMVIRPENIDQPINYILEPEAAEVLLENNEVCDFESEKTTRDHTQADHLANELTNARVNALTNGDTRRIYNLALVLTGEFYSANGGTVASATAVATTGVNNIQAIYDRELAIRFNLLVPFVYTDSLTDPFVPDNNVGANSRTVQAADAIAANFALAQYDVGHVFHNTSLTAGWSSGGVAGIGVVCNNGGCGGCTGGVQKGRGWTGRSSNVGAAFARLGAHEFGHQFGANHTFNGSGGACTAANISSNTSYEIGSGTTIMSYRNICSAAQNIPAMGTADDYFHTHSLTEIINYINGGGNCPTTVPSGNTPPTVDADPMGITYNIPVGTPFTLTGSGLDADGDAIMYCWEQYDEDGAGTPTQGSTGIVAGNSTTAPLFRSFPPTSSPSRTFPQLSAILDNDNMATFEALPLVDRNITFRLTGRDFNPLGGGTHCSTTTVIANDNGGAFEVTSFNSGGVWNPSLDNTETITWNVAGSTDPPINCANVNILLSLDEGETFTTVLASNTPNDGSASVVIPVLNACEARIRVECADNIFFDINNADVVIDVEAPTITVMATDRVVECDGMGNLNGVDGLNAWLANRGGAFAFDNCDPFVIWSNTLINTAPGCGGAVVFTYRFTVEDDAGNTASTEANFEIIDTTPPDLACPADITISCDESDDPAETGIAIATDICDPAPTVDYDDMVISGNCNWECTIERTWSTADDCGNMTSCVQEILSTPLALIQDALSMGPIVLGGPGVSLTLTIDDAECIVDWLSEGFGNADPAAIPWGNHTNDPLSCQPGPIEINPDGTMANPLLAAQIFMAINLRLDPTLGDLPLSDTGVPVDMVLIISMPNNPTIADLFDLTNIALWNIYAPHLDFMTASLLGLNEMFSFCNGGVGSIVDVENMRDEGSLNNDINNNSDFFLYPNPADSRIYFELSAYYGQSLVVEIYNLQGQLMVRQKIDKVEDPSLFFSLEQFEDAVYLGVVHSASGDPKIKKFWVEKE